MIFNLQFALIFAGYGAVSNLSGQYIKYYTNASDFQLGLYFMIPPLLVFTRPIICAQADRKQTHKQIFTWCLFGSAICYFPYVLIPFLIKIDPSIDETILTKPVLFWLLTICHLIGSVYFNGVRTLADALAVNHAQKVNMEYVSLRKWAPIGFGLCGLSLGPINQDWLMPDFVPSMLLFCICMVVLGFLVYLWPDEYFTMATNNHVLEDNCSETSSAYRLPTCKETTAIMKYRLRQIFARNRSVEQHLQNGTTITNKPKLSNALDRSSSFDGPLATSDMKSRQRQADMYNNESKDSNGKKDLSLGQQLNILRLIIKRDFRIGLALILLLIGGWICRSAQNFVFMYAEKICLEKKTCNASSLAGYIIAGFSVLEFITYITLSWLKNYRLSRLYLIQLAILSLAIHYYFLAFVIDHVSPYFFLIESLHGLEFALFISTCLHWGFMFASEVEYIIPELIERQIINEEEDDLSIVKVSLVATMMSCMTLAYDGIGSMSGAIVYGWVIEHHSYNLAWLINGSLSALTFILVLVSMILGKSFKIKPRICKLQEAAQRRTQFADQATS